MPRRTGFCPTVIASLSCYKDHLKHGGMWLLTSSGWVESSYEHENEPPLSILRLFEWLLVYQEREFVACSFDVEYIYGFVRWGVCRQSRWRHSEPQTRWRICVTMTTLWHQQDGGYMLLWKRYGNNKMAAMRIMSLILHLQQYSHRLNLLYIFFFFTCLGSWIPGRSNSIGGSIMLNWIQKDCAGNCDGGWEPVWSSREHVVKLRKR